MYFSPYLYLYLYSKPLLPMLEVPPLVREREKKWIMGELEKASAIMGSRHVFVFVFVSLFVQGVFFNWDPPKSSKCQIT